MPCATCQQHLQVDLTDCWHTSTGFKKLSGALKKGLHLGKDSPRTGSHSPAKSSPSSDSQEPPPAEGDFRRWSSGGVRFSTDEPRVIDN